MAKGFLSIEIAETKIRYLYVEKKGANFQILKSGSSEYQLDITDEGGLSHHVKNLLTVEEIVPQQIFLSLSSSESLIRQVTLPKMRVVKEIEGIIESEVEKVPAFADVTFDFIYSQYSTEDAKTRVIFSALKNNILDYIFSEVKKVGSFEHFAINPLNLKDLIPQASSDQTRVLLVIGEAVSYFIIFKGDDYKLFYKTTLGLKNLSLSTGLAGDNLVTGLTNEVQRVLKSYLADNKDEVISAMHLIYDQQEIQDLHLEIQKKLGLEVEALHLADVIDSKFEIQDVAASENSAYVLCAIPMLIYLRGLKSQFRLEHFFREQQIKKIFVKALICVGIFVLFYGAVLGMVIKGFYDKTQDLKWSIEETVDKRKLLKAETKDLFDKKKEYIEIREGLLSQATYVKILNRISWSQVFTVVSREMPEGLSLSSFEFNKSGKVFFDGEALNVESVSNLLRSVNTSQILSKGKFDHLVEKELKTNEQKFYSFGILASLRKAKEKQEQDGAEDSVEDKTNQVNEKGEN